MRGRVQTELLDDRAAAWTLRIGLQRLGIDGEDRRDVSDSRVGHGACFRVQSDRSTSGKGIQWIE